MLRSLLSDATFTDCVKNVVSASTTDINGTAIDLLNANGALFRAKLGESGDTLSGSVKLELELEHSDDGTNFTDCADADLSAAVTGTNPGTWAVIDDPAEDGQGYNVEYRGGKRYVRPVVNKTGTHTNGIAITIDGIVFGKRSKP